VSLLTYKWYPSPSYSPNAIGSNPRLLVCHTTEGAQTNDSIKNYLTGHNGVSYHASVDNYMDGIAYEYVYEDDGAWAQCGFNDEALCCVFCTPGGASNNWSSGYWSNDQALMMRNMAKWLADQSSQYSIPLIGLTDSQAQGSARGVCQHKNLGSNGCSHHDCGQMPMQELLRMANEYQAGEGAAPPKPEPVSYPYGEDTEMILSPVGEDGKVTLPIPKYAGHLRLGCVQGGVVRVEWVGSSTATREYDLNNKQRQDVPCGSGSNGLCVVYVGEALGPVGAAWIQVN